MTLIFWKPNIKADSDLICSIEFKKTNFTTRFGGKNFLRNCSKRSKNEYLICNYDYYYYTLLTNPLECILDNIVC